MVTRKQSPRQLATVAAAWLLALMSSGSAQAQFSMVPAPLCAPPRESVQEVEQEFRIDAARHLYSCYPMRVYRGILPPLISSARPATRTVTTSAVAKPPTVSSPWAK